MNLDAANDRGLPGPATALAASLPTLGNMVFVSLLLVLVFHSGQGLLGDGDTGYHIKTGELILRDWRIPAQDPFSFHTPTLHWTAHEWLSAVLMAVVFKLSGLTGVVLFFAILLALTHWLLYRLLRSKTRSVVLCALVTLLATATSSTHWLARPHVFSLLLTVVWYAGLDRYQYRNDSRFFFYAPVLMLAWANLHGGYIFGLILIGIYSGGNWLTSFSGSPSTNREHRTKAIRLGLLFIGLLGVCLLNPQGIDLLWFPFRVTSDRFVMDHVIEFLSPNFHAALPFKYMILALIGALALSRSSLNLIEASLVVLLSYMSLYSVRHVSLFAIIIAPILLRSLENIVAQAPDRMVRFLEQRNRNFVAIERNLQGYLWPVASLVLVCGLAAGGLLVFEFDREKFPVDAVEFLKKEPVTGRMFNNDEYGDYVIFAAWPAYRVFMDGRSDMYGAKYGRSYFAITNVATGWQEELAKYDITWVFFDTNSALTAALKDHSEWHPIYSDRVATIFVKRAQSHAYLIAKYHATIVGEAER